jgi:acetolactate synthase-1/3 small subunit
MKHVISALVMNQPGVLAHVSGMLASRAFNIESLAVGATENSHLSRMTFVVNGDEKTLDQVQKQLEKIVTVVKVIDFSGKTYVERDLMLLKVSTEGGKRSEVHELVDIFRARIVDVGNAHVMIEISGQERKIDAFIDIMRPFGIIELVRTGRIALLRSAESPTTGSLPTRPLKPPSSSHVGNTGPRFAGSPATRPADPGHWLARLPVTRELVTRALVTRALVTRAAARA